MKKRPNKAFSLVELSIVLLIIGVLIAAIGQGLDLLQDARISAARILTQGSRVNSLNGLILWLEPTSENSFTTTEAVDGSTISAWKDINPQAKNKNDFTASGTAKPTYKTNAINNLPALLFNGTNNYMDSTYTVAMSTGVTVFAVVKPTTVTDGALHYIFSSLRPTFSAGYFKVNLSGNANLNIYYTSYSAGLITTSFLPTANQKYLIEAIDTGTKATIYANKTKYTSSNVSTTENFGIANIAEIGACYDLSMDCPGGRTGYFNGYIAEIIVFDRGLIEKERLAVESYLAKKWNF
ncbi:MAG: prepilin-type N-terminal cleavage/methylation domain-containing protein [Alphaproteobacteria bacterium]|nr:prepilin-type N-terminal cleavage/methylation domain-containing protein [Alphaproteobacteria bacterium]